MGQIIYYTGGAKSGKSRLAQEAIKALSARKVAYMATQANVFSDAELQRSIEKHREARPDSWQTYEQFLHLDQIIQEIATNYDVILVDCMTVWLTNNLFDYWQKLANQDSTNLDAYIERLEAEGIEKTEQFLMEELDLFLQSAQQAPADFTIISNELGLGLVPANKLGRIFRNIHGLMNQSIASQAEQVYWVVSGIEVKIK